MNQRGNVILIVLLIAAAVGGYLIYTNYSNNRTKTSPSTTTYSTPQPSPSSSDEIANWKTYTNTTLGYTIKYPPSWNLYEFKNYPYTEYLGVLDKDRVVVTTFPKFPKFSAGDSSGDIYTGMDIYLGNELYSDISDVLKRADKPDVAGNIIKFRKFIINGITAYQETRSTDDPSFKTILIPYKIKPGIIILTYGGSQDSENEKQDLEQILTTFKFTQ